MCMLTQLSGAPSYQNCAILVVLFTYIKIIQIHEFPEIKNVEEILECHEYSDIIFNIIFKVNFPDKVGILCTTHCSEPTFAFAHFYVVSEL